MAVPFRMPVDENIKHLIKTLIMILTQARLEVSDDSTGLLHCMDNLHAMLLLEFDRRNRDTEKDCQLRDSLILLKCKLEEQYPNSLRNSIDRSKTSLSPCETSLCETSTSLCDDCKSAKIVNDAIDNQLERQQQQRLQWLHHHHHHNQVPDREQFLRSTSYQENLRENEMTDDSAWWLPMSLRRSLCLRVILPVLCVFGWHLLEASLGII